MMTTNWIYGFTSITDKGVVRPQCVIYHKILTAELLRPSKIRLRLETKARTKSHEGRTAYLPFDREGTVSDRAFIPYHKSLGKVE